MVSLCKFNRKEIAVWCFKQLLLELWPGLDYVTGSTALDKNTSDAENMTVFACSASLETEQQFTVRIFSSF